MTSIFWYILYVVYLAATTPAEARISPHTALHGSESYSEPKSFITQ
ncbi:MAG: hypothetical protein QW485_02490 [Desulfurococcaceae archaeon]